MARLPKPAAVSIGKIGNSEKKKRLEQEAKLKGGDDKIIPPEHLTENQKRVFIYIVDELRASGILGNLDIFLLTNASISIDRLQEIETSINEDSDRLLNKALMSAKTKYQLDFFKSMENLSLSPASRAKLGAININAADEASDPLLQALGIAPKRR